MAPDTRKALYTRMQRAFQRNAKDLGQKRYLPPDCLSQILTHEIVASLLKEAHRRDFSHEYIASVMQKAPKTFALLVYIDAVEKFASLYRQFDDSALPIGFEGPSESDGSGVSSFHWHVASLSPKTGAFDDQRRHPAFDTWSDGLIENFEQRQWIFLAVEFSASKLHHQFHPMQPLPILEGDFQKKSEGHFSLVYKAKLPISMQLNRSSRDLARPEHVAVKKFRPDVREFFKREFHNLEKIDTITHPHLIRPLTTFEQGEDQFIVFPWADGGNLREFWGPKFRETSVLWVLKQMHGISQALKILHGKNGRHGDIKPENILRFRGSSASENSLVIADVGLAKFHQLATSQRDHASSITASTVRYEAPEMNIDDPKLPRSRRYDIWSIGCVYLEFVIWITYGDAALKKFNAMGHHYKFWDFDGKYDDSRVKGGVKTLHPDVQDMIKRLLSDLPRPSALRDVVKMIRDGLLVINLARDARPPLTVRWIAPHLFDVMDDIWTRAQTDQTYALALIDAPSSSTPLVDATARDNQDDTRANLQASADHESLTFDTPFTNKLQYRIQQAQNVKDVWIIKNDNTFARKLLHQLEWSDIKPALPEPRLCNDCQRIDFQNLEGFRLDPKKLQQRSSECDFCDLCYKSSEIEQRSDGIVRFKPTDRSSLISVYVDPESDTDLSSSLPIGFPQLPDPGSAEETLLLKHWLRNCDENHTCIPLNDVHYMPTRVIDVFADSKDKLRLVETCDEIKGRYVAVSHCWGNIPDSKKFCLLNENIEALKENIDYAQLPQTFRDVVDVSRRLEVRYLWLDSICIIQNNNDDWASESTKMESVYSSSYVTIAVSSAASSLVGLPKQRDKRPCVRIGDLYFAKDIDDFETDVQKAVLNTRGWVFQEHALSRRCIHFTTSQIYWECGDGIHCETLAKLSNPYAAFLGDAHFPNIAQEYFKGGKILHFQGIFQMYSKLAFTKRTDRSLALQGLENRLAKTMKTKVKFGILENMLGRSLLWRAATPRSMERITFDQDRNVPSWSWMAYLGAIAYEDVPFADTEWCTENIRNPFGADRFVFARDFELDDSEVVWHISYDLADTVHTIAQKCVIIGKEKNNRETENRMHYVLIIQPSIVREGCYERTGPVSVIFGGTRVGNRHLFMPGNGLEVFLDNLAAHSVTTIDTAQSYGNSEATIGHVQAGDRFSLDTKWSPSPSEPGLPWATKDQITNSAQESIVKLGVKQVDVFFLHRPDPNTPISETLDAVNIVYKNGIFRRFGLSGFPASEVEAIHAHCIEHGYPLPAVYQGSYNPFSRSKEIALLPTLRKLGMAFYAYGPSAGGFLGKTVAQVEEMASDSARVSATCRPYIGKPMYVEALARWNDTADAEGVSAAELAYRWVACHSALSREHGDALIIGASSPEQLEETLSGIDRGPLSDTTCAKIHEIWESIKVPT
ncbi:hypothetical protein PFICI_02646 [Pestalotiopsis fici W106-1]|uniref:Protein kinase domain-containing protein n=1 Tax=Pestalotiopsis fici (strain W106-1 / CGMCC3.15140) TaxID=1229662 RepID=W3XHB9_PESFW|nr:uncharacterized protein PFICI_02646 [Pestalotiopsis fici W106-1]ETS84621.1 hypothetical protein PFICI_02646 [Pestalotiopsis fici W106-1]